MVMAILVVESIRSAPGFASLLRNNPVVRCGSVRFFGPEGALINIKEIFKCCMLFAKTESFSVAEGFQKNIMLTLIKAKMVPICGMRSTTANTEYKRYNHSLFFGKPLVLGGLCMQRPPKSLLWPRCPLAAQGGNGAQTSQYFFLSQTDSELIVPTSC